MARVPLNRCPWEETTHFRTEKCDLFMRNPKRKWPRCRSHTPPSGFLASRLWECLTDSMDNFCLFYRRGNWEVWRHRGAWPRFPKGLRCLVWRVLQMFPALWAENENPQPPKSQLLLVASTGWGRGAHMLGGALSDPCHSELPEDVISTGQVPSSSRWDGSERWESQIGARALPGFGPEYPFPLCTNSGVPRWPQPKQHPRCFRVSFILVPAPPLARRCPQMKYWTPDLERPISYVK